MKRIVKQPEERRRELIAAALKVFCEKGYEQTSIRDILGVVGGEVGMFYHHFKSKDEIFYLAVELFLEDYITDFSNIAGAESGAFQQGVDSLIALADKNITKYTEVWSGKLHWSMAAAVHKMMLERMLPSIERLITGAADSGLLVGLNKEEIREAARFLLYGISGVLHEKPLTELTKEEYQAKLLFVNKMVSRFFNRR
jgi:AcrR family transcriptional regulator